MFWHLLSWQLLFIQLFMNCKSDTLPGYILAILLSKIYQSAKIRTWSTISGIDIIECILDYAASWVSISVLEVGTPLFHNCIWCALVTQCLHICLDFLYNFLLQEQTLNYQEFNIWKLHISVEWFNHWSETMQGFCKLTFYNVKEHFFFFFFIYNNKIVFKFGKWMGLITF